MIGIDLLSQFLPGSTDLGNVSQVVPCILPAYDIGTHAALNSVAFHEASGTAEAHGKHKHDIFS